MGKKKKVPSMADLGPLVSTLGVGTFLVGIVLHTFFGIDLYAAEWVPQWLKAVMVSGNVPASNLFGAASKTQSSPDIF